MTKQTFHGYSCMLFVEVWCNGKSDRTQQINAQVLAACYLVHLLLLCSSQHLLTIDIELSIWCRYFTSYFNNRLNPRCLSCVISLCICWCCAAHSMKLCCRYMYTAVNLMQVLHTGLALLWCQSLVWLMQASIWTLYPSFIHTLFPLCKDFQYSKPS